MEECKLGDICNISSSKRIFAEEYVSSGIPFYRGKEIIEKHNKNTVSSELFITHERFAEIKSKFPVPQIDDILLTSVGTLGIPWLVNESNFYFKDGNLTWFRSNTEKVNPKFLYYWFESNYAKNQIDSMCIGSTQKALTIDTLSKFSINLPPLPTQQKIATILSSLDDKIELNNKINTNLEQQAGALFEDFFPNVIDDDGLNKMEELITFSNGKKRPEESGIIPVFGGNGILAYTNKSNNENCCIIGRVGAYCGNVFLSQNKCWISDNAISAKSKDTDSQFFIFYLLKKANLQTRHIGSGQPLLTQGILNSISINIPQKQTIEQFNDLLKPIFDQIFNNSRQNENLVSIRDTLLPKLMNGEFEVLK